MASNMSDIDITMRVLPNGWQSDEASLDAPAMRARGSKGVPHRTISTALVDLDDVPVGDWQGLADHSLEANAFYSPDWARAVNSSARHHAGAQALLVFSEAPNMLIGLLPVRSARKALSLPLPILVGWQAYATLTSPLLHRDMADVAANGLIDAAQAAGARALLMPRLNADGLAAQALSNAVARRGITTRSIEQHARATLDATADAATLLRQSLGAKKLKELRRQRHRLSDDGEVTFATASDPVAVAAALEEFLQLEMLGWKGRRGTALAADAGDQTFIRNATQALAHRGQLEIATLRRGGRTLAAGIVLRQNRRAFFFKIAFDETLARLSPGVQLTLDLTQHLCADAGIDSVDSMADANHPMINHVWRARQRMTDLFIPTQPHSSVANILGHVVTARSALRGQARRIVHLLRNMKDGNS